jgi:hypothetical protein
MLSIKCPKSYLRRVRPKACGHADDSGMRSPWRWNSLRQPSDLEGDKSSQSILNINVLGSSYV